MPLKPRRSKQSPQQAATETKAIRMVERLRQQHKLGCRALAAKYEGISTAQFAAAHGYSAHTIRKFKAFADAYQPAQLDELCRLRRQKGNGKGLPLHWGYIPILLAIEGKCGKAARRRFQLQAIREGWTVPELRRTVRERIGTKGHGRSMTVPADAAAGLAQVCDELAALEARCQALATLAKANDDLLIEQKFHRLAGTLRRARKHLPRHHP
jgi:hypothetical protein